MHDSFEAKISNSDEVDIQNHNISHTTIIITSGLYSTVLCLSVNHGTYFFHFQFTL